MSGPTPPEGIHLGDVAADLALGALTGRERAEAVAHLEKCPCTASKLLAWCLTWGSLAQLRRPVVLVDHAIEDFSPLDRQLQRRAGPVIVVGRSLLARLVRAVSVVMAGVCCEHRPQVRFAVDQHPVGALRPHGAHPPLGIAIGSRRPRRDLDCFHVLRTGTATPR